MQLNFCYFKQKEIILKRVHIWSIMYMMRRLIHRSAGSVYLRFIHMIFARVNNIFFISVAQDFLYATNVCIEKNYCFYSFAFVFISANIFHISFSVHLYLTHMMILRMLTRFHSAVWWKTIYIVHFAAQHKQFTFLYRNLIMDLCRFLLPRHRWS